MVQTDAPQRASRAGPTKETHRRDDAWRWHGAKAGGSGRHAAAPPGRAAKGPPPPKPPKAVKAVITAPVQKASKLHPALLAKLQVPLPAALPAVPIWSAIGQRVGRQWSGDAVAALVMLLPVLLTAALLSTLPRMKSPMDQHLAGLFRSTPKSVVALAPALPPYRRPAERVQPAISMASHDLAHVVGPMARDIADLRPPFRRPAESLSPHILPATHDLTKAVFALQGDVDRLMPPYVRPAEALVATLPVPVDERLAMAPVDVPALAAPEPAAPASLPLPKVETGDDATCHADPGLLQASATKRGQSPLPAAWPTAMPHPAAAQDPLQFGLALAAAAKAQANDLVVYNARYMQIAYPRGDVPALFGVCTDVVIRAYRALDIDLQELVHLSRAAGPSDKNIDHRRTELLRRFLAAYGAQLATSPYSEDYLPGDVVTYYRPQNKSSTAHIAIVTDVMAPSGRPMIAHNRGWGVQLEDALFVDQMTGHYRFRGLSAATIAELQRSPATSALAAKRDGVQKLAAATRPRVRPVAKPVIARAPVLKTRTTEAVAAPGKPALTDSLAPPMGLGVGVTRAP
jgi:uncharacterized protein YijF (DUF1287 family)